MIDLKLEGWRILGPKGGEAEGQKGQYRNEAANEFGCRGNHRKLRNRMATFIGVLFVV